MNIGDQIKLPEISMKPAKEGCGTIYHVVEKQIDTVIHSIETRRINLFVEEKIYITKSGHRLLIDSDETAQISNDISGVLRTNSDSGKLGWSYHKKLEELKAAFSRGDTALVKDEIVTSWNGKVKFPVEKFQSDGSIIQEGLRPPQVAALHAIISHWTLETEPATVVMPTGTGKTETMLGVFVQMINETVVIAVPTQALLQQTIRKFERLGLLHNLGVLPPEARCPIVGVFNRRPKTVDDLAWVKKCNVVIGLVSTLAQGTSVELLPDVASQASHLIIDEAHHIAAKTWSDLRGAFLGKPILQSIGKLTCIAFSTEELARVWVSANGQPKVECPVCHKQHAVRHPKSIYDGWLDIEEGALEEGDGQTLLISEHTANGVRCSGSATVTNSETPTPP